MRFSSPGIQSGGGYSRTARCGSPRVPGEYGRATTQAGSGLQRFLRTLLPSLLARGCIGARSSSMCE